MALNIGWKITNARDKAVLLAYQRCLDQNADRFIIEATTAPHQLKAALHLLLSDVCARYRYRIRYSVRTGFQLRFEATAGAPFAVVVGEWIGNRNHGVVFVNAVQDIRRRYQHGAP